jgi:hypothetical protein
MMIRMPQLMWQRITTDLYVITVVQKYGLSRTIIKISGTLTVNSINGILLIELTALLCQNGN